MRYGRTPVEDLENFQEIEMHKDLRDQPAYRNPFEITVSVLVTLAHRLQVL